MSFHRSSLPWESRSHFSVLLPSPLLIFHFFPYLLISIKTVLKISAQCSVCKKSLRLPCLLVYSIRCVPDLSLCLSLPFSFSTSPSLSLSLSIFCLSLSLSLFLSLSLSPPFLSLPLSYAFPVFPLIRFPSFRYFKHHCDTAVTSLVACAIPK